MQIFIRVDPALNTSVVGLNKFKMQYEYINTRKYT